MASSMFYEVRHWRNGVRTCAIFPKESQAQAYADRLPKNKHVGKPSIKQVWSSQNEMQEFSNLRKRFKEAANATT